MDAPTRRRPAPPVVLLFGAAVGLLVGMVWAMATPTVSTATATVYVSTQGTRAVPDPQEQAGFDQQAGDSFASVASAPIVLDPVARELGSSAAELARHLSVEREAGTAVLRVSFRDPSASRAAAVANAVAERLVTASSSLAPNTAVRTVDVHLTQVLRASAGSAERDSGIGTVLAGLLAGTGLVALALLVTWLWPRRPPAAGGLAAPSLL